LKEGLDEVEKAQVALFRGYYAETPAAFLATRNTGVPDAQSQFIVQYPPLWHVLGIFAWNAPVWLELRISCPHLIGGNTCVLTIPKCALATANKVVKFECFIYRPASKKERSGKLNLLPGIR